MRKTVGFVVLCTWLTLPSQGLCSAILDMGFPCGQGDDQIICNEGEICVVTFAGAAECLGVGVATLVGVFGVTYSARKRRSCRWAESVGA